MKNFFLVLLIAFSMPCLGYDIRFKVDQPFLVEARMDSGKRGTLEIWDIHLLNGFSVSREINDVTIVRIPVGPFVAEKRQIIKTNVLTNLGASSEDFIVNQFGNEIQYTFGMISKVKLKISFDKSGNIRDIAGYSIDMFGGSAITYALVKESKTVTLDFINNYEASRLGK
jgi:hypothetical protein